MVALPFPRFGRRPRDARPLATVALGAVAEPVSMVDGKALVPERHPDGDDLDPMIHKRKDGTK